MVNKVADLLARGVSAEDAAKKLKIAVSWIYNHRRKIDPKIKVLKNQNIDAKIYSATNCTKYRWCMDQVADNPKGEIFCLDCQKAEFLENAYMMELHRELTTGEEVYSSINTRQIMGGAA